TDFDRNIFPQMQKPPTLPGTGDLSKHLAQAVASTAAASPPPAKPQPQPTPAPVAPEPEPERVEFKLEQFDEIEQSPLTPTERMFIRPVNLTFERKPPVRDLPGQAGQKKSD
ncbi:MAG TPA: hypothetical protein VHL11_17235, partial [Phototrophicaceae bacterium]|nr:hypothetical protein [Phototrophicaceae bacterium]